MPRTNKLAEFGYGETGMHDRISWQSELIRSITDVTASRKLVAQAIHNAIKDSEHDFNCPENEPTSFNDSDAATDYPIVLYMRTYCVWGDFLRANKAWSDLNDFKRIMKNLTGGY